MLEVQALISNSAVVLIFQLLISIVFCVISTITLECHVDRHVTLLQSRVLMSWLPARIALNKPRLLFTTLDHGNSITTFFHMVDGKGPTVIIIKSVTNAVSRVSVA